MPRKRTACGECGKTCRGTHCIGCAILLKTRKPKGKWNSVGDPRSGAFKQVNPEFGARHEYHNTARAVAPVSWWLNPELAFTSQAEKEVLRMSQSTFGRRSEV